METNSKNQNLFSILIIAFYFAFKLFGPFIAQPFMELLFGYVEFDMQKHYLYLIDAVYSMFVPVLFAILLQSMARRFGYNPMFWFAIGLVFKVWAVVLLVLVIVTNKPKLDFSHFRNKFHSYLTWILIVFIISLVLNSLSFLKHALFTRLYSPGDFRSVANVSKVIGFLNIGLNIAFKIWLSVWIYRQALRKQLHPVSWVFITLLAGLLGPILYYIYLLAEKYIFKTHQSSAQIDVKDTKQFNVLDDNLV